MYTDICSIYPQLSLNHFFWKILLMIPVKVIPMGYHLFCLHNVWNALKSFDDSHYTPIVGVVIGQMTSGCGAAHLEEQLACVTVPSLTNANFVDMYHKVKWSNFRYNISSLNNFSPTFTKRTDKCCIFIGSMHTKLYISH